MICAWNTLISILPNWMRSEVDKYRSGCLQEIRLRIDYPPVLILEGRTVRMNRNIRSDDLLFCINMATKYSPWAAGTVASGYITIEGGHRIGICGEVNMSNKQILGIKCPSSLCIRISRNISNIAAKLDPYKGSVLIIGKPGTGKTTLLRDLIRRRSEQICQCIAVIDEKEEIFPKWEGKMCFEPGANTDVLSGCLKPTGIEMVLRNMGPAYIAVDEITAASDCDALIQAGWCGVSLIATAHASNKKDLFSRPVYRPILDSGLFETLVVLQSDKSYAIERVYR